MAETSETPDPWLAWQGFGSLYLGTWQEQGFSEPVAETAFKVCHESTQMSYGARASYFANWCAAKAVDPYTTHVTDIADFILELVKSNPKEYSMALPWLLVTNQQSCPSLPVSKEAY